MIESEISEIAVKIQRYKSSLPKLTISLLGPGEDNVDEYAKKCYNKRCEIKDELNSGGDEVFFPEEACKYAEDDGIDVSNIIAFEVDFLIQEADIILMIFALNASGVMAELIVLSQYPESANKMYVFYDSSYYSRGDGMHWPINNALDLVEGNNGMTKPFTELDLDGFSILENIKETIEKKRRVFSLIPYRKYKGVV